MATRKNPIDTNGHHENGRHTNRIPPTDDLDHRDSRQIKQRIDQTRGAMDETLDELGERLNPRNLLDDVLSIFQSPSSRNTAKQVGDSASDFATNLGRQVRDNPIGASLVGAGLAWLALGNRREEAEDNCEPIPRRRALQDDFMVGGERLDDDPGYYTEDDLLLDTQYDVGESQSDIVVPESYRDDGSDENSPGLTEKARRTTASAASSTGDAFSSAWDSTKSTASSAAASVSDTASSTGDAISDAACSAVDGVKSAASSVGDAVSSAGATTKDTSRRAYLRSRAAARDAARGTRQTGRQSARQVASASSQAGEQISRACSATARRVERAHDEAPLALGLGIMALGAIAGALIPRTRREDELMGETSDEAIRQTRSHAEQVYQRGQEAVENTVETAKQSAESQGLTGESLAERAARTVEKAADSISDAAKEEGLHPQQLKDDAKAVADDAAEQAKSESADLKSDAKAEAAKVDQDAKKAIES
ncbi:hypothetical protein LF1_37000 [Rubripirellula obstinata]|uniref:DUF3618 domain-containing protein n=1 Tax=Rubripirellula obstinata TaxID=406547 RepID=A0A5B1CMM1_9BACT|nr:DUF3618 domain-containing protein [Rubripirellula obstinata]KAA1261155.1 hypothetical protein LF1_37000 [Rubripirellula obstinata]